MTKKRKQIALQPGWAIYLRTSDEDAQNPQNSRDRQRHTIDQVLLKHSELPVIEVYADVESGRNPNRREYQRMLRDARAGKFSHIAMDSPDRFGRDQVESIQRYRELGDMGIEVHFAKHPGLHIRKGSTKLILSILFACGEFESDNTSERVIGGLHAKMRSGGFVGRAPDGYRNTEAKTSREEKFHQGRYTRWIEIDPDQAKVWRAAWDMLLSDTYTLKQICEELHARGYRFRDGRLFVQPAEKGKRSHATNTLSAIFHNPFYAGWLVSPKAEIPYGTLRGNWEPLVTTDEFERGLQILERRYRVRYPNRKHFYLLKRIAYVEINGKVSRLSGSTPNINRPSGGNPYYCLTGSNVNIPCDTVEEQLPQWLKHIFVCAESNTEELREAYRQEARTSDQRPAEEVAQVRKELAKVAAEQERMFRMRVLEQIPDAIWNRVWSEVQSRRAALEHRLSLFSQPQAESIENLDVGLDVLHHVGELYATLAPDEQQKVLQLLIQKVVVDRDGTILRVELHPPFAYLVNKYWAIRGLTTADRMQNATLNEGGVSQKPRSEHVRLDDPHWTRTSNQRIIAIERHPIRSQLGN